jgi:MoaA/NifB/PqqE/SkfB family radical SAM enzyme
MHQKKPPDNLVGLHIEPTNICTLKCAGCSRTRFINQWPQHWKNHNLNIDDLLRFLDIDLTGLKILLCGNYGDPIYHPDFVEFVAKLKQRGSVISIVTNGSYRTTDWWKALTSVLTSDDCITFSIDGIPTNFTQYRVNADWNTIKQGIEISVESACQTGWKYIPFSFNSADIESAKHLSQQLGIDRFFVDPSDRFDEQTEFLKPSDALLGPRHDTQVLWKSSATPIKHVDPKCANKKEHFITADGYYSPCCFVADHRFYYKTQFGKQKNQYNIQTQSLSQILEQPTVIDFYQNLPDQPVCQFSCPG